MTKEAAKPDNFELYIEELTEDALHYARYGRYSGSFRNTQLYEVVTRALTEKPPSEELVVELQKSISEAAAEIPYETFSALKTGWSPAKKPKPAMRIITYLLVALSILIMIITANLTLVHNRGADLVDQAALLLDQDPEQTLNRLVREHFLSRQMLTSNRVNPANRSEATVETSQDGSLFEDLVPLATIELLQLQISNLSRRMQMTSHDMTTYTNETSRYPIAGMQLTRCIGDTFNSSNLWSAFKRCTATKAPVLPMAIDNCGTSSRLDLYDQKATTISGLEDWRELMERERSWLQCNNVLRDMGSTNEEVFRTSLEELKRRVGYYALWILPAIYGAMGAVMYHMRWVLHPLLPFPSMTRLVHRIVLSSLVGVVLGWLYSSNSSISDAAGTVGFSLFLLAFLFGFSLDAFFTLIDRFIIVTQKSIGGGVEGTEVKQNRLTISDGTAVDDSPKKQEST